MNDIKKRRIEEANKRLLGENMEQQPMVDVFMFHCDAKSCEHYKEQGGTTNCVLRRISISAKGGCNQYEPSSKE
jgi:hypothetical protein